MRAFLLLVALALVADLAFGSTFVSPHSLTTRKGKNFHGDSHVDNVVVKDQGNGFTEDWGKYLEFKARYKGVFYFTLPATIDMASLRKINVHANLRAEAYPYQIFKFSLYNFASRRYEIIGKDVGRPDWSWHELVISFEPSSINNYVKSDSNREVRVMMTIPKTSPDPVGNLDWLSIEAITSDPVCGDGVINQESESCDGGANCNADCTCATGFAPTSPVSAGCQALPVCGDGVINQESESCDGGANCNADCTCATGFAPTSPVSAGCQAPPDAVLPAFASWANLAWGWPNGGQDSVDGMLVVVVDLFDTSENYISELANAGHHVLCYFSAGSKEDWRPDVQDNQQAWDDASVAKMASWDEAWLDVTKLSQLEELMAPRMDLARQKGCHSVEPDNIDCYQNSECYNNIDASQDEVKDAQRTYNKWQAMYAHSVGLKIALKNALEIAAELEPYYDMAMNEQCHQYNECNMLEPFLQSGKLVMNVEYSSKSSSWCDARTYADKLMSKWCDGSSGLCQSGTWNNCFSAMEVSSASVQGTNVAAVESSSSSSASTSSSGGGDFSGATWFALGVVGGAFVMAVAFVIGAVAYKGAYTLTKEVPDVESPGTTRSNSVESSPDVTPTSPILGVGMKKWKIVQKKISEHVQKSGEKEKKIIHHKSGSMRIPTIEDVTDRV